MEIRIQLPMILWISIWISVDFYGYPCIDLLWILDPGYENVLKNVFVCCSSECKRDDAAAAASAAAVAAAAAAAAQAGLVLRVDTPPAGEQRGRGFSYRLRYRTGLL